MILKKLLTLCLAGLSVLYPFSLWFGYSNWICLALAIVWAFKAGVELLDGRRNWFLHGFVSVFFLILYLRNQDDFLLMLYPSFINLGLFIIFAWSLRHESIITQFAQMEHKVRNLSPLNCDEVAYTKFLTLLWCSVFLWNALLCVALIFAETKNLWILYSGIGGYVLMGFVFVIERMFRSQWKKVFLVWRERCLK